MRETTTAEARLEQRGSCEFRHSQAECPVILAGNGSVAIEFYCDGAQVRPKIALNGRQSGECGFTIPADRHYVVEHGCVIGTIRNEDIAQNTRHVKQLCRGVRATLKEFR